MCGLHTHSFYSQIEKQRLKEALPRVTHLICGRVNIQLSNFVTSSFEIGVKNCLLHIKQFKRRQEKLPKA